MVWYILDRVPQYWSTWYILDHNTGPHPDPARSSPITLCNAKTARNEAEIRISRKKIIKKSQQTLAMSQPSFITCTLNIVQNTMKGWYKCLRSISGICKVVSKRYTEGSLWEARCLFWCWRWTFLVHGAGAGAQPNYLCSTFQPLSASHTCKLEHFQNHNHPAGGYSSMRCSIPHPTQRSNPIRFIVCDWTYWKFRTLVAIWDFCFSWSIWLVTAKFSDLMSAHIMIRNVILNLHCERYACYARCSECYMWAGTWEARPADVIDKGSHCLLMPRSHHLSWAAGERRKL